jgi:hypothetical protein
MNKNRDNLEALYSNRKGTFIKKPEDENFLKSLNLTLRVKEKSLYKNLDIDFPFIFIYGLPRSGTTLTSQLLSQCLDVGYINNFMARFYLAPLHGIRLSKLIYGDQHKTNFQSEYARTSELTDIHEFGYFWRYWLKKEKFSGVTHADKMESEIDWQGLKNILANIQHEFGKSMLFKNIFGSYHLKKLNDVLGKVIYIYIKRDLLDTTVSILDARRRYYSDPNTWWSYMPVEFEKIKDLDYWHQIAGQVFFLKRYYDSATNDQELNNVIEIQYKDLTSDPAGFLDTINKRVNSLFGHSIEVVNQPPRKFEFKTYENRDEEKEHFAQLLDEFSIKYG